MRRAAPAEGQAAAVTPTFSRKPTTLGPVAVAAENVTTCTARPGIAMRNRRQRHPGQHPARNPQWMAVEAVAGFEPAYAVLQTAP